MLLLWLDSCVSLRANTLSYKLSLSLDQIPLLVVLAVYVQGPAKNSHKAAQSILAWNYSYFYTNYLITNLNIDQLAWYLSYMSSFTICIFNFIPAHETHTFSHTSTCIHFSKKATEAWTNIIQFPLHGIHYKETYYWWVISSTTQWTQAVLFYPFRQRPVKMCTCRHLHALYSTIAQCTWTARVWSSLLAALFQDCSC